MPDIITKIFHEKKKRVKEIIFNQDKSRFALVWKCMIEETTIKYYADLPGIEMDFSLPEEEKLAKKKAYVAMKEKCEKFLEVS